MNDVYEWNMPPAAHSQTEVTAAYDLTYEVNELH